MFNHILIATDGSEPADKAVALALRIAGKARLTAMMVVPDYDTVDLAWATFTDGPDPQGIRDQLQAAGRKRLEVALRAHDPRSHRIERLVAVSDRPYQAIVDTAKRDDCDLIVMAPRGRGMLSSALLGSQTARVMTLSSVPVLVAP
jgi:nucleotide-binding universal stress UspA family protein